jgi:hypothetical protein
MVRLIACAVGLILCGLMGCESEETGSLVLDRVFVGSVDISLDGSVSDDLPVDQSITLLFSKPLKNGDPSTMVALRRDGVTVQTSANLNGNSIILFPDGLLLSNTLYTLELTDQIRGAGGESFKPIQVQFKTTLQDLQIITVEIGGSLVEGAGRVTDVPLDFPMVINFSGPLSAQSVADALALSGPSPVPALQYTLSNNNTTLSLHVSSPLKGLRKYTFSVTDELKGSQGESFPGYSRIFYTEVDETPKFPVISDDELLTKVQQQTFKYFWDFAHPASGMARERNTSGNIVTSGGTGFGIMSLVVGMERGFITRQQGIERVDKIVTYLENADRFHGVWSHWLDGNTGKVIPFSAKDDGGDLVETSFLVQGLLTVRQYLKPADTIGNDLIKRITTLWEEVEWDWYRKNNEEVLYWHWSPNFGWDMNLAMYGYFEEQITYFLAAASPTHSIPKSVYTKGYGKNGDIVKNNTYYGHTLPLESPAPLFWVHYSYLGFDPHFSDAYADYWEQNVNASLINHAYCVDNPKDFVGYSDACWGLTSSDNQAGYGAHSPANDLGVITPTAALSSFPYTPTESMNALKFFYYTLGDRLWGPYGFYDAFNITEDWTADSYLAIDQGPIIVMIENYRTGLLWDLFMSAPEVQEGIDKLDFTTE